jgi:hypothetical protein
MISFKLNTKDLKSTLKMMKLAFAGQTTKMRQKAVCEITIKSHHIELVVTGIQYTVPAESSGAAKIVVQFFPFLKLLDSYPEATTEFRVSEKVAEVAGFSFPVKTTFFEEDAVLRSIILPMNYTDTDLLQLLIKGYTKEELEFNRISPAIEKARKTLISNINVAFERLKQYGVTNEDLKKLVIEKLGVNIFNY